MSRKWNSVVPVMNGPSEVGVELARLTWNTSTSVRTAEESRNHMTKQKHRAELCLLS